MNGLTYDRVLEFWLRNRKITIYMVDSLKRITAFATSRPHSREYRFQLQHAIDDAELFRIGAGHPMERKAFEETIRKNETLLNKRSAPVERSSHALETIDR